MFKKALEGLLIVSALTIATVYLLNNAKESNPHNPHGNQPYRFTHRGAETVAWPSVVSLPNPEEAHVSQ